MSVEITVEPAPTTPVITVNPAGEVTCTVTYSTLTGSINNPGGANGSVQIRNGASFAGIAPDTDGNVLTISDGEWVSATPDPTGMVDPGSNGVVVRTALNTTTARTIAAGTNVSVNNGSGVSGDPTISVADASTTVKGVVELATDGEVASGLAVQANDARLSNTRTPTAHASTHVTGGTDKIRDATASQDGLMTTAYASKLDAITGTNTGDQTITLTGDVTGSGTGSFAATIANQAVTFAKMQHISTAHLLGRHSSGSGDVQQIGIDGGLELQGSNLRRAALTGDVTASAGSNTTIIAGLAVTTTKVANDAITYAKMQNVSNASRLLGRGQGSGAGDVQEIQLVGLSMSGTTLTGGDMLKGTYDQLNTGFISGKTGLNDTDGLGGIGGTLKLSGGDATSGAFTGEDGGPGGSIDLRGGNSPGSSVVGGAGGSLVSTGSNAGGYNGGTLNMSGGASGNGGSITTFNGGGGIDTTGQGAIGLGVSGTRTNLFGGATADRSISFQDSDGTLAFLADITGTNSGTNTGDVTLAGENYLSIVGQTITAADIALGSNVSGILGVANGGTGATTLTANNVLLGNGTSALQTVAPSTTGNVLTSNGTTWTSAAPAGATYATDLQARQGLSTTTAIAPATMWSAIHDSLFIADFSRFISTAVTGSGSIATTGGNPHCITGATANSTARGYWITQAKSGSSGWANMDYSRPSSFGLTIMVGSSNATSTGILRVWFGTDTNASSIAARGYGFEVRHHRVWIIAHNGTTLSTQDTGVDIASTAFVLNVMRCVNDGAGNISMFMNNAQIGTALTGGPTTAGVGTLNILNLNGANAATNDIRTVAGTFTANVY